MWPRICVAFGVLSGLPVPKGDLLASLHSGFLCCLDGSTEPGMAARGRLDREKVAPSHAFHPFRPCRTLRVRRKRRPPPARERLAEHSGDGSEGIVGMGLEGGDRGE